MYPMNLMAFVFAPPTAIHHPPDFSVIHTTTRLRFSESTRKLTTPPWRFILLSDGHIHNLLSHLVEFPLSLTLHSTEYLDTPPRLQIPHDEQLPDLPCVRRSITLHGSDGIPILYASSLWNRHMYDSIMRGEENQSLYHVLNHLRLPISRAILAVHYGTCDQLCPSFAVLKGSEMWAREYVFRRRGTPFVLVQEVLSPRLQKYLGEIVPPEQVREQMLVRQQFSSVYSVPDDSDM